MVSTATARTTRNEMCRLSRRHDWVFYCSAFTCQHARGPSWAVLEFGRNHSVVIAGLDPAIHFLRKKPVMRWTPGSSPGVTNVDVQWPDQFGRDMRVSCPLV